MGYRELATPKPRPKLDISGVTYDIDYFGMDDGELDAPDDAFRFVFQLGQCLMIHLYVIQAGGASAVDHFSHSFWIKDCAVAHVDQENLGPPASVDAVPIALPLLYDSVTLLGAEAEERFDVHAQSFRARHAGGSEQELEMRFAVTRADGEPATLIWTRRDAWVLHQGGRARPLQQGQWLRFTFSKSASGQGVPRA